MRAKGLECTQLVLNLELLFISSLEIEILNSIEI
jgi:hypothetical protein